MVILRPEEPLDKIANPFLILKGSMKQEFQKCSVTWEMIFFVPNAVWATQGGSRCALS